MLKHVDVGNNVEPLAPEIRLQEWRAHHIQPFATGKDYSRLVNLDPSHSEVIGHQVEEDTGSGSNIQQSSPMTVAKDTFSSFP